MRACRSDGRARWIPREPLHGVGDSSNNNSAGPAAQAYDGGVLTTVPVLRRRTRVVLHAVLLALATTGWAVRAAELQPPDIVAFDAYRAHAEEAFLARPVQDWGTGTPATGAAQAGPGEGDGITHLPGALVHHWRGMAFIRGAALHDVVARAQRYDEHPRIYQAIKSARILEHDGNTFRTLTRIQTGAGGLRGVLDVRNLIVYSAPEPDVVVALSNSEEIREVKDVGTARERHLPEGDDSGYLWRASTFTRFVQVDEGVSIEMESIGLSRRLPRMTAWLIEPFVRTLGRRSVEGSLKEFVAAVSSN